MNMKKALAPLGISTGILVGYQGWRARAEYRENYRKEEPLPGPHVGIESRIDTKITTILKECSIYENGLARIKRLIGANKFDRESMKTQMHQSDTRRNIKLLILGDSLVSGVGCESNHAVPILPQFLAKVLSKALDADVEWISEGKIGGTVSAIRQGLLPKVKQMLVDDHAKDIKRSELVVVVICGLNDWREMLESFPFGLGDTVIFYFRLLSNNIK